MSGMLLLALLIVIVSGLIAYVGDLIGRKMGRKRLTLMGLRPRHTAIVISVGAGMLIAILTLAAALTTSRAIRDAFVVPISQRLRQLDYLQVTLKTTQDELSEANTKAKATTDLLQNKDSILKNKDSQLKDYDKRLIDKQKQLVQTEKKLAAKTRELTDKQLQLDKKQTAINTYDDRIKQRTKDIDDLKKELSRLSYERQALTVFFDANFTPLAFAKGQEIISGLMPTGVTSKRRKELLQQFLATAERIVRQQCSELPATQNPVVFLKADNQDKKMVTMQDNDAIQRLSDRISRVTEARDVIIRFNPANNVPVNGQVFILIDSVDIIPNTQVFSSGAEVAKVNINITSEVSEADILGKLVDGLLREQIPAALREKKMPMILRRFDPDHTGNIPAASLSLVSWADLVAATDKAQAMSGKVSIVAKSAKSINRFDPLALTLDVVRTP